MKKEFEKSVTAKRIEFLFEQAAIRPSFAKRYVALARGLASKFKVRIPIEWRGRFCKSCNSFFVIGKTCRVRVRNGRRVFSCLVCSSVKRVPFKR